MFSSFALPDPFLAVLRASCPVFMFCAPGLIFGGIEGVGSRFYVLRSRTCFRRYRRCREQFSCFKLPDPFSAVSTTSGPVFMFFAPGLIFGGSEGVVSHFRVLRSRTRFRRYRRRWVQFSCFVLPDSFSTVPRVLDPVFMFCAPGPISGGTDGEDFCFHVLRSWTRFRRYRRRPVPLSCFALPYSFSAVPRASGAVLLSRNHFLRYRGRWVQFTCFALQEAFSAVPRASCPVIMFCTRGPNFDGIEAVVSRFHVLRSRTYFRRYRRRRVLFSCFALKDPFLAVPTASGPIFMFCVPGPVFGGTDGVRSSFYVLRSQTRFPR
jgi:hypothetical protein